MISRFVGKKEWLLIAASVLLIIGQIWMDIKIPEYMGLMTDAFLISDLDVVQKYGWEMILCAVVSLLLSLGAGFLLARISASIGHKMRQAQFDRVQAFSVDDINRFSAASLITRTTNDVTQIQNFIARGLQVAIKSPIITVWAITKIYGTSWEWTLVTAAGAIALGLIMMFTLHFARKRFVKIQWLTDDVNRATRESIDGIRVIRAYNAEGYQEERFATANDNLFENNRKAEMIMAPAFPLAQSMMNFVTMGIYWVGAGIIMSAGSVDEQMMLFSDMIVFTSYATMVLSSFMQLFGIMRMLPRTMVGIRRVREVVGTESTILSGDVKDTDETGTVEFRDVSFKYPGSERYVLKDVSFKVGKGRTLAIIGTTGSGKTSLVNLIPRFYDVSEGTVLVDGVDVKDMDLQTLRLKLGYVPQNAIIFSGSVDENVNYGAGSEDRGEEEIRRALDLSQASEFVQSMPEKGDTYISQRGKNISGGQKQRIAIARALCRDPEILLLDDTFSALDYKTDLYLRNALESEMGGTTRIMVAQRIGTIMDADEIIVLDGGRVVGQGTHDWLMESCPLYREIAESQSITSGAVP